MDKVYSAWDQLDKYLNKNGQLQKNLQWAEVKLKVNKKSLVIGSIGLITWMLFGILAPVVVSIISFVYPVLQSMRAVETNVGTGKWLTYWMVYACFTTFESIGRPLKVLDIIPFFYTTKLAVLLWCMAPIELNGSKLVYKMIVLPFFGDAIRESKSVDRRFEELRSKSSSTSSRRSGSSKASSRMASSIRSSVATNSDSD